MTPGTGGAGRRAALCTAALAVSLLLCAGSAVPGLSRPAPTARAAAPAVALAVDPAAGCAAGASVPASAGAAPLAFTDPAPSPGTGAAAALGRARPDPPGAHPTPASPARAVDRDGAARAPVVRPVVDGTARPTPATGTGGPAAVDGLDVATAATYVLDAAARRVRVDVDITAVNRLSDTAGLRYYYPAVNLAIQPEAASITAQQAGARDRATTEPRSGYRLLAIEFHTRLYAGQTAHVHLAYVLPAGAPRSTSGVRVGAAYSTFVAWAFGDRGTVEVDVPGSYEVGTSGDPMTVSSGGTGGHVLTSAVSDPGAWYAWIDARNDAALSSQVLDLPGGEQVVVRAWPEDAAWRRRVAQTLTAAIPVLVKKIGLPWPVSGRLTVLEVSAAQLEGYAGFYSASAHEITVSEDLDPFTIVHEASHAWFNESLFTNRWITEGLANEYAYRTLQAMGASVGGPGDVRTSAPTAFALDTWGPPAAIKTRTQDAREQWAYDASWTVVREVVAEVGESGMSTVFAAAAAGTTAYPGGGPPERAELPSDWRRLADLAEQLGGGTGIAEIIAPWALTPVERTELGPRAAALAAYRGLVAAGGAWAAPLVVRMDLDGWDFGAAEDAIAAASTVLRERDAVAATAAAERLSVPAGHEASYEAATTVSALVRAGDDEAKAGDALDAVAAADRAADAPRDGLVSLGLLGSDPAASLAAARAAWEAGDLAAAQQGASTVAGQLAVAADAGRLRLVAIGAAVLALVLLVAVARAARRRARPAPHAGDPPGPGSAAGDGPDPSARGRAAPDPSPILPASATTGNPRGPRPGIEDEGAE